MILSLTLTFHPFDLRNLNNVDALLKLVLILLDVLDMVLHCFFILLKVSIFLI